MMNMIVSLMAAGAKKRFSREEYRQIRGEANALFQKLTEENKIMQFIPFSKQSVKNRTASGYFVLYFL